MRTLYFDIDGTILVEGSGEPKPALAQGKFEAAIRNSAIDALVCVGNFVDVVREVRTVNPDYDGIGVIFDLCQGVFTDLAWFRRVTNLARDAKDRARAIPLESDWWYVDDLAEHYMSQAGLTRVLESERGRRILVPTKRGDGSDVISWLNSRVALGR